MSVGNLSVQVLSEAVSAMPHNGLEQARARALQSFLDNGAPDRRHEDWKYTDLSFALNIGERWLCGDRETDATIADAAIEEITSSIDAVWIVFKNGRIVDDCMGNFSVDGARIDRLSKLDSAYDPPFPLADLNAALLDDGVILTVEGDLSDHKPLGFLIADSAGGSAVAAQTRIDIVVKDNAAVRLIEYHTSAGNADHWSNTVINLRAGADTNVSYQRLQIRDRQHVQTQQLNVLLEENSTLTHHGVDIGGKLIRNDLRIDITAAHARARFDGLYIVGDGQHIDNHTRVDHRVGPAESRQEYRGVLNGRCRAIWNGKAIVHAGADGTDAQQANHNLLLSEHAEIDAKPELEIYADDVKCSHGTTVGQLDEDALFYLRTRGLDDARARRVLTRAFAAVVVDGSPIAEIHDWIGAAVEHRLIEMGQGTTP